MFLRLPGNTIPVKVVPILENRNIERIIDMKIHLNTYENRVTDYELSGKVSPKKPKKSTTPKDNPYLIARNEILDGLTDWRRKEILVMESENNLDNRVYNEFTDQVHRLGDKYSDT